MITGRALYAAQHLGMLQQSQQSLTARGCNSRYFLDAGLRLGKGKPARLSHTLLSKPHDCLCALFERQPEYATSMRCLAISSTGDPAAAGQADRVPVAMAAARSAAGAPSQAYCTVVRGS
jgi:hypothetical protein